MRASAASITKIVSTQRKFFSIGEIRGQGIDLPIAYGRAASFLER